MAVLVGRPAPDFTAPAVLADNTVVEDYHFADAIRGKYAVLFFWPLDFTFVCPSELIAFDHRIEEFKKRNVEVVGVSIDSPNTHFAWRSTPVEKGGVGQVHYTMVADMAHRICRAYDVETPDNTRAFRGTFLIDREGIVRHQLVNDLPLGRDIDETLRMVDALQFYEEHGEVCPAGWTKGKKGVRETPQDIAEYLAEHAEEL